MVWQKDARGVLYKSHPGQDLSPASSLEIQAIKPLYLRLKFNGVSGTNTYQVGYTNDAATGYTSHGERTVSLDGKGDLFTLKQVIGAPDNPTELRLEINKSPLPLAVIGPGRSFERIVGYAADLKYPPETRSFANQRESSPPLTLSGVRYKIVAITPTNVVVSAPNDKHTTIPLNVR